MDHVADVARHHLPDAVLRRFKAAGYLGERLGLLPPLGGDVHALRLRIRDLPYEELDLGRKSCAFVVKRRLAVRCLLDKRRWGLP